MEEDSEFSQGSYFSEWTVEDFAEALHNNDVSNYKSLHDEVQDIVIDYNIGKVENYFLEEIEELERLEKNGSYNEINSKCRKLNNWLYVIRKSYKYIFTEVNRSLKAMTYNRGDINDKYHCSFHWLLEENEYENLIKLYMFNEHIHSLKSKSTIIAEHHNEFFQYVQTCIETYKKYKNSHCNHKSNKNNSTLCEELENFKKNYENYLLNSGELKGNFLPLESVSNGLKVNYVLPMDNNRNGRIPLTIHKTAGCNLGSGLPNNSGSYSSPDVKKTDFNVIVINYMR